MFFFIKFIKNTSFYVKLKFFILEKKKKIYFFLKRNNHIYILLISKKNKVYIKKLGNFLFFIKAITKKSKNHFNFYFKFYINIIEGFLFPYKKEFFLKGKGLRFKNLGENSVVSNLGYSHNYKTIFPRYLKYKVINKQIVSVFSMNKNMLHVFLKELQQLKYPDIYKGNGIHIVGDNLIQKKIK